MVRGYFYLITIIFVFALTSCDMFTSSLGTSINHSKSMENSSVEELVSLLNSEQILSTEDAKAIVNILNEKNMDEFQNLSYDDIGTIISTIASAILPSPNDIIEFIDTQASDEGMSLMDVLVTDGLSMVDYSINTWLIESFFIDDETIENLLVAKPDAVLLGTITLLIVMVDFFELTSTEDHLQALFDNTFIELATAYANGYIEFDNKITEEEKAIALAILATDLGIEKEKALSLLNVAIALYCMDQEEGLSSFGGLEEIFNSFLDSEIESATGNE